MNVFIADDSDILRQRLKRFIMRVPDIQICGEAAGISEAISLIHRLTPDVIILDIQFSDGLGFEIYDRVVTDSYRPFTLILTNYPTDRYRKMCRDRKIECFFDKTTDFEKIYQVLSSLTSEARKTQKH